MLDKNDHLFLYHQETSQKGARLAAACIPPFGPGLADEVLERVERLEVWCTGFDYQGDDFTEFRAFDANDEQIATTRVDGY